MGKAQKKKKTQAWRHNPIRVPDAHLPAGKGEGQADPSKEKQMLPVFTKLKSGEYADRTWACSAICNLIQNDPATRRLFQSKNVVGELIERLSDSVDEVVVEASGALRNLAIDGGHELCAEMFNKGLMAHLVVLIQKISSTIDSVFATTKDTQLTDEALQARKHLLGLTENVLSLVWSMAETSHKALEAVNGAGVEELLVKVLDGRDVLGYSVAVAAAQALYSLSQDNWPFKKKMLNEPAALQVLAKVVQNEAGSKVAPAQPPKSKKNKSKDEETDASNLTRLLVCGALRNIVDSGSPADQHVSIDRLTNEFALALIDELLSLDTQRTISRVFELVNEASTQAVALAGQELKTDHRTPAEAELDTIERKLNTVVIGLEVLTGICAGIQDVDSPEEQEEEESEEEADFEEVDDEEMDEDLPDEDLIALARGANGDGDDIVTENNAAGPTVHMPVTSNQLLKLQLPARLTKLATLTPLSFPPSTATPSPHPPTTSLLSTIHLRALEALNNLFLTFAAAQLSEPGDGRIDSQSLWDGLLPIIEMISSEASVLGARGQEMRGEVLDMVTGALWGVVKLESTAITVTAPQIQLLFDVLSILRKDDAKSRTIDTLALVAARSNVTEEENKMIGDFLISALNASAPSALTPELLVSVVNAIIDIYADETRSYDVVFTQNNYLKTLASQVNRVRNDVKKIDRRKDREARTRGEETYENLVAFIKYRRDLGR